MREEAYRAIMAKFENAQIWSYEETENYVYFRFTVGHKLYLGVYYKDLRTLEIFTKGEKENAR